MVPFSVHVLFYHLHLLSTVHLAVFGVLLLFMSDDLTVDRYFLCGIILGQLHHSLLRGVSQGCRSGTSEVFFTPSSHVLVTAEY